MNTFFPIRVFFPVVDIQGGEDDDGLVNFGAGEFMEGFSDFSRIGGIIHPYQEFFCSKGSVEHLPCLRIFRVDGFTGSQPIKYIILHSLYYSCNLIFSDPRRRSRQPWADKAATKEMDEFNSKN